MATRPGDTVRSAPDQGGLFAAIWVGVALQVIGQAIDFRWHAAHPEFETASDQLQAHWLLWIGSLVTLIAAGLAARALRGARREGLLLTVWASVGYVAVSVWHFLEHARGADPAAPHVLLVATKVAILVGVIWATVQWRAARRRAVP
jgi:hypothetical protein